MTVWQFTIQNKLYNTPKCSLFSNIIMYRILLKSGTLLYIYFFHSSKLISTFVENGTVDCVFSKVNKTFEENGDFSKQSQITTIILFTQCGCYGVKTIRFMQVRRTPCPIFSLHVLPQK